MQFFQSFGFNVMQIYMQPKPPSREEDWKEKY